MRRKGVQLEFRLERPVAPSRQSRQGRARAWFGIMRRIVESSGSKTQPQRGRERRERMR